MKHLIQKALVTVLGVGTIGLVGCEWGGGQGGTDSGIANFNGNYQANGGYLVSEYTVAAVSASSNTTGYVAYTGEDGGSTGINKASLAGKTQHGTVKPGSVTIVLGGVGGSAHDNGSGGMVGTFVLGVTNKNVTGSFEYSTGVWTLQMDAPGLPSPQNIFLNYLAAGGGSSGSGGGTPGSSGVSIFAFNVQQSGSNLKIVDNNGSIYQGSLGDVRTTGNLGSASQGATFVNGDQVIASFSASGTSAAGIHVNLVGNFQGTAQGVSTVSTRSGSTITRTTSMALTDRIIVGTWIEDGGKTGNISGISPASADISLGTNIVINTTGTTTTP